MNWYKYVGGVAVSMAVSYFLPEFFGAAASVLVGWRIFKWAEGADFL